MYNDSGGHCTVGVGHLVHRGATEFGNAKQQAAFISQSGLHVEMTKLQQAHWRQERPFFSHLSNEQIINMLHSDIQKFEKIVQQAVKTDLSQAQFDALVSFCFNIGGHAFQASTLVKLVNQNKFSEASDEFLKWTKANHQIVPGLIVRREHERSLFIDGDYRTHEHKKTAHLRRPKHNMQEDARRPHHKQPEHTGSPMPSNVPLRLH